MIENVWFNDPNVHTLIHNIVGDNLFIPNDPSNAYELLESESDSEDTDGSQKSWDLLSYPDRLISLPQGRSFAHIVVNDLHLPAASPRGHGPAVPDSATNHDANGIFPHLHTTIFGPTHQNVNIMRQKPANGIAINRSSAIFTVRYKPEEMASFSALFTGDAHDHLPTAMDIRGPVLLPQPQHWLVMKVPHHGSKRSENFVFYHNYTAQYYLISSWYSAHK